MTLDYYQQYILPPTIYRDHIKEIIQILEDDGILRQFEGEPGLRWADFSNDLKCSRTAENETFKCMAAIAATIVGAARRVLPDGPQPTTVMECQPHKAADSEGLIGPFISDGHYRVFQSRRC